jgi:hypothetical protein
MLNRNAIAGTYWDSNSAVVVAVDYGKGIVAFGVAFGAAFGAAFGLTWRESCLMGRSARAWHMD